MFARQGRRLPGHSLLLLAAVIMTAWGSAAAAADSASSQGASAGSVPSGAVVYLKQTDQALDRMDRMMSEATASYTRGDCAKSAEASLQEARETGERTRTAPNRIVEAMSGPVPPARASRGACRGVSACPDYGVVAPERWATVLCGISRRRAAGFAGCRQVSTRDYSHLVGSAHCADVRAPRVAGAEAAVSCTDISARRAGGGVYGGRPPRSCCRARLDSEFTQSGLTQL